MVTHGTSVLGQNPAYKPAHHRPPGENARKGPLTSVLASHRVAPDHVRSRRETTWRARVRLPDL